MKKSALFLVLPLMAILVGVSSCKKEKETEPTFSTSAIQTDEGMWIYVTAASNEYWNVIATTEKALKAAGLDPERDARKICAMESKNLKTYAPGCGMVFAKKGYELEINAINYIYTFTINNLTDKEVIKVSDDIYRCEY